MAKQKSLLKIEGTLSELTFYKSQDGHLVKMKGGIDPNRIATDPTFARTRENGQEFGHSATAGKMLRLALRDGLLQAKDNRVVGRLTQVMRKVLVYDTTSDRGLRQVKIGLQDADARALLVGFDFNIHARMAFVLKRSPQVDLSSGEVVLAGFNPGQDVEWPEGATHLELQALWANVDFSNGASLSGGSVATRLAKGDAAATVTLAPGTAPSGSGDTFVVLLLTFYQLVNGQYYSLNNNARNALQILAVG
jgi:hypothetical protein